MKYETEVLLKVQALEKMILQDFHNICKEHKADYFIMYGSGIGVERHIITGADFLIDGGATASYFYGPLKPQK